VIFVLIAMSSVLPVQAQGFNFKVGIFYPKMESDLWVTNMENLTMSKQDMQAVYYGLEYENFINRYMSVSIEGGYYEKEHYASYRDYEYDDGSPIEQNVGLQIYSLEAGMKIYPLGQRVRFCPYFGGGAGLYYWKYKQWGDFINFDSGTVSEGEYAETSAYTPGANLKGGFILRLKRNFGIVLEAQYQYLKGELSSSFEGFEKLDLNGFKVIAGINFFLGNR